eukprot:2386152-Rhodomonas_salina.1
MVLDTCYAESGTELAYAELRKAAEERERAAKHRGLMAEARAEVRDQLQNATVSLLKRERSEAEVRAEVRDQLQNATA